MILFNMGYITTLCLFIWMCVVFFIPWVNLVHLNCELEMKLIFKYICCIFFHADVKPASCSGFSCNLYFCQRQENVFGLVSETAMWVELPCQCRARPPPVVLMLSERCPILRKDQLACTGRQVCLCVWIVKFLLFFILTFVFDLNDIC